MAAIIQIDKLFGGDQEFSAQIFELHLPFHTHFMADLNISGPEFIYFPYALCSSVKPFVYHVVPQNLLNYLANQKSFDHLDHDNIRWPDKFGIYFGGSELKKIDSLENLWIVSHNKSVTGRLFPGRKRSSRVL